MVGREKETKLLEEKYRAGRSDFLALYGRRRVGKTYLIREAFRGKFTFQLTGLANASLQQQLANFKIAMREQHSYLKKETAVNWMEAFQQIKKCAIRSKQKKKVLFIDELPWFDTPNSDFIQALEHFWNSWASARKDILLVVCGSSASWMINKLINNKGGLHNRVTLKMKIEPFTLNECELFLRSRKINIDRYQIIQLYMVLGGIPFYWDEVKKGKSATQLIDKLCFTANGLLRSEFPNIFRSLFTKAEKHQAIVTALAKKSKGLTREELIAETKISNGGSVTRLLTELEESGFIRKYIPFERKARNSLYQLSDFYTLFYLKFIKNYQLTDTDFWIKTIDSPRYRAWSGYAFEQACLCHLQKIKQGLGISGIETQVSSWRSEASATGAQIDLLIDRRDQVINLCEMKFSINPFIIDKKYDAELRNKIGSFKNETQTRKSVFLTLITTFGLQQNAYSGNVQNDLKMDILFAE
ncbi:MAG: AAA family ATPase [Bacteroidia bacterium]|nr:AAA family ATPase [Bacteroidia bacterium]